MKRIVSFLLSLSFILFSVLFVLFRQPPQKQAAPPYKGILRLWHIDSFEGGKGSRANFLKRAASQYEKSHNGVYFMVNTYTAEGAAQAIAQGDIPDLISFSCGLNVVGEHCRALSVNFSGGVIGKDCYAYPWCGGGYYLFCLEEDFSLVNAQNLVISDGGNNLPWVAAALHGLSGEIPTLDSTSAYVQFLKGEYRYMLGTQRDVCRFQTRGATVYRQPLQEFNDLFQYIAVTTPDADALTACMEFTSFLLSDAVQEKLTEIGMYSAKSISAQNTLSAFVDRGGLEQMRQGSKDALQTGQLKILKNYLKPLN